MALILNIETATKVCSVSLGKDGNELATIEFNSPNYSHAEKLNSLIIQLLKEAAIKLSDLDAVAVSEGPGSYTGLRIGTSTAKGLCYGLDIPLIAINSLKALARLVKAPNGLLCPLFDARRMEVYAAIYSKDLDVVLPTKAIVIDADSFQEYLANGPVCFFGPGADKCKAVLGDENAIFLPEMEVSARGMIGLSEQKFNQNQFEDTAYFEPFYLKDFIAGEPKKIF
jgi:tRNA threonylcarbamoyladenosine biosynthesis protein TsaB